MYGIVLVRINDTKECKREKKIFTSFSATSLKIDMFDQEREVNNSLYFHIYFNLTLNTVNSLFVLP